MPRKTLFRLIPLGFLVLIVFTVPNRVSALQDNGIIEMPFSENTPTIDGRWTTEDEWLDATVTEMSGEGQTVFLLIKHDRDYLYVMFDAVTDQTKYSSQTGGIHFVHLLFDTDNNGGQLDSNDIWMNYGIAYDTAGREARVLAFGSVSGNTILVGNSETNEYVQSFEPRGFDYSYSTTSRYSAYESGRDHYIHEFRIPLSFLHKQDSYGFAAIYRFGDFQNVDIEETTRVLWPPGMSGRDAYYLPDEWGSLVSPTSSITAPPVPVLSVSDKSLSFGKVVVSEKSSAKTVTISNKGTSDLRINSIRATGEFSLTGTDTPSVIQPGQSASFQVAFVPLSLGDKSGTISIVSNDLTSPTYTVMLDGEGVEKAEILAGGGCLIATAAYGSEFAPQVQMLREIRDNQLLKTASGSAFMSAFNSFYYSWSPTVAEWERQNPAFKEFVRMAITPLITTLSLLPQVSMDTEQEALGYGIGIIMLNIGIYFVGPAFAIMFARSWIRQKHQ